MSSLISCNGLPLQNHKQNDGNYGNYNNSSSNGSGNNNNNNIDKFDVYDIDAQPQRGGEVTMISNVDTMKLANSALKTQSKYLESNYSSNDDTNNIASDEYVKRLVNLLCFLFAYVVWFP